MRKIFLAVCVCQFFVSCWKDSDTPGNVLNTGPLLSKILVNGQVVQEFSYNNSGQLVQSSSYSQPGSMMVHEVINTYTGGVLSGIETAMNFSSSSFNPQYARAYAELTYDSNGKLKETRNYRLENGNKVYASRSVPAYDTQGKTISVTIYDPADKPSTKITYQYDAKGNVTKEENLTYNSGTAVLSSRQEYEHDDRKNPLKDKAAFPYGVNANNVTKLTRTSFINVPGIPNTPAIMISVYKTYNTAGYPTLVNENGMDYVYEYK